MNYINREDQPSSMRNNLNLCNKSISEDLSIQIVDKTCRRQLDHFDPILDKRWSRQGDECSDRTEHFDSQCLQIPQQSKSDYLNQKWLFLCKNNPENCSSRIDRIFYKQGHLEWNFPSVIDFIQMVSVRCLFRGIFHRKNKYKSKYKTGNGLSSWITFFTFVLYVILSTSPPTAADYYSDYVSVIMKSYNVSACDGEYLRIDCPEGTSIDIQRAMYGRKVPSIEMCPSTPEIGSGSNEDDVREDTNCEAKTGAECQDKRMCRLLVHRRVFGKDPCPGTSKYLTVQYRCAPKDFREQSTCSRQPAKLGCRQDTIISVFKIIPTIRRQCLKTTNKTICSMAESVIFDDVTSKCHSKEKCSYILPSASCFNHVKIVHACVPKEFLTSELPSSVRSLTTTRTFTSQSTEYSTKENTTAVQTTVNIPLDPKGESTTSSPTSTSFIIEDTSISHLSNSTSNVLVSRTTSSSNFTQHNFRSTSDFKNRTNGDDVIITNDFPIVDDKTMDNSNNSSLCIGCTPVNSTGYGNFYDMMMSVYVFLEENSDDILIAVLLAVVIALLLTICVLVIPCKFKRKRKEAKTIETTENSRQNVQEEYSLPAAPTEEDEHENMSLMGSILQRSISSTNTIQRQQISPKTSRSKTTPPIKDENKTNCGPKSIFAKICCNCCCNNAPWQRTQILKRHRGDVYHVTHRCSSSIEDEDITGRFQSRETFPVFSRTDDNVDNRSPIPALEDHVNQTEHTVVTSAAPTSQQNSNFRPISRSTQRHYSATPEPDYTRRTNRTFRPNVRHEGQRSDPALNIYSVHNNHYNSTQPMTAPTSPVISHQPKTNYLNGTHKHFNTNTHIASTPKAPQMGLSLTHNSQLHIAGAQAAPPQSPRTPKYTPPPNHFYSTTQYPSFTEAYEQYDNAQRGDVAVRKKQFHRPQFSTQYSHEYTPNNGHYAGYYPQNNYGDQFVQAIPRRTNPSHARTVDLAANARTVDLSHDNSLSRNSWLEIRRSSIYDNSLPRNSEMYEYYQQLQQHEIQQHNLLQHQELPGSRNLNQYY